MKLSAKRYLFGSLALLAACSSGLEQGPELQTLATTSLRIPVSSSADDAEEGSGRLDTRGKALDFSQNAQTVVLRFTNVKVPQGAKIKSAIINFTAIADDSAPVDLQVRAEDSDNAAPFGSSIKTRAKTSASSLWQPRSWKKGQATRTSDLSRAVQEVVSRSGWQSGNALAFYVTGDRNAKRSAYSRDKSSQLAPRLSITFEAAGLSPTPSTPTPAPTTPSAPSSSCLNRGNSELLTLSGSYDKQVTVMKKSSGVRVDARNARFLNRAGSGPSFHANLNAGSFCLSGGFIDNGLSDTADWNTFHSSSVLLFYNTPNAVIENVTVHQAGDGITIKDNNPNWVFRDSYVRHAGDDGVENDRFNDGLVDDVLIDWAYTGLSCRKEGNRTPKMTSFTVRDSLIALKPQKGTYGRGSTPSHSELFKMTKDTNKGCILSLKNNVFLISGWAGYIDPADDPRINYDPLNRAACRGNKNIIVYTGDNPYYLKELREAAPECFDVTTDIGVWKAARARWFDRHPGFSRYRGAEPSGARN